MTYPTQYALINKCEAIEPHGRNKAHNSDFNLDNEYLDMRTKQNAGNKEDKWICIKYKR